MYMFQGITYFLFVCFYDNKPLVADSGNIKYSIHKVFPPILMVKTLYTCIQSTLTSFLHIARYFHDSAYFSLTKQAKSKEMKRENSMCVFFPKVFIEA